MVRRITQLENIIGALDIEPKNYKEALTQACWIEAMQEELHEFERLEVWELVPPPVLSICHSLKWIIRNRSSEGLWYPEGFLLCTQPRFLQFADHAGCQILAVEYSGVYNFWRDRLLSWIQSEGRKSAAIFQYGSAGCMNIIALSDQKDIDIRFHFIRSMFENGNCDRTFTVTRNINWSGFHKALGRERIDISYQQLGMRSFSRILPENNWLDEVMNSGWGKCNLRLSSDITSKEATLQVVYDVLKLTPFYKAFQVTADAPEIYMQEFWASAYVHNRSVRFKMNNKKHIIGLEHFRDILQICPKVGNKKSSLTLMSINFIKPWRSFAAVINKCLCGTPSYDSLRLSQAQILWGMYNKKNVDYAYLLWEDFIFKIENKSTKKGSAMYYPRFTKLVVNYVMEKDPSIPRRNKVNWHYARDDPMFTTINVISRNEATQLYGAILPVALTNEDIRNSESYKEYYAMASGTIPPKTKGSKKKANTDAIPKQKPPTAPKEKKSKKGKLKSADSHASGSGADEGTGITPGVPDAPDYDSEDDISWKSSDDDQEDDEQADDDDDDEHDDNKKAQDDDDEELTESDNDDDDFVHPKLTTHDDEIIHEEDSDEDDSSISSSNDEDSDDEDEGTNVEGAKMQEEATETEDQGNEEVKDTNADLDGRDKVMTDVEDTHVTLTPVNPDGQQQSSSVSSGFVSSMLNPNQDTGVDDIFRQHTEATSLIDTNVTAIMEPFFTEQINRPPTPHPIIIQPQQLPILTPATTTSSSLQNLPNFASLFGFDHRLKALEDNFSELRQTNQYAEALSSIPSIVDQYLANKMQEAVDVAVQLKYDRIREESTSANQQFLDSIDEGMKKIIKEQVKKEVSKITPKIEKLVTDQLESEVLVRSSKEANTSHAVAANLSELELKKILIDKMEANNSINRSDIQRQLYKALVDAYEADKILLDTYGDTVTIKRPRDGADDDQEPSAGTDRGSKRRRSGKEPASTSAPSETTTKTAGKTTSTGSKTHKKSASQSALVREAMQSTDVFEGSADQEFETGVQDEQAEEEVQHLPDWFQKPTRLPSPDHAWNKSVPAVHESVQPWLSNLAQQDPRESFDELTDSTFDFSAFVLNRLNVQTLTPELLAGPTFELMKGTCKSLTELEYFCEEVYKATTEKLDWINPEGRQYPHDLRQPLPQIRPLGDLALGQKRRQFCCLCNFKGIRLKIRRDDDVLYKFKEGDFHRLRIQDIEDMLLLLVQGKVTNLSVEERIAFNVSLRMFTRSVVIQRRVEDLQLGVESYQKKLNLTKPDTYRSNLRRQDAYTPHSDPRGFIYENKDKKNRLMRIDELHKFSDGTLDDVRTALNDRLKGIRMEYLPQTFWSQRDKANAGAMIQAIDKRLKTRRIMRSLERFVGGRPYGGDLRLLQRTI
ncbi:hypothetical protein Tco_0217946 [Tanacetum coccineum]